MGNSHYFMWKLSKDFSLLLLNSLALPLNIFLTEGVLSVILN